MQISGMPAATARRSGPSTAPMSGTVEIGPSGRAWVAPLDQAGLDLRRELAGAQMLDIDVVAIGGVDQPAPEHLQNASPRMSCVTA